MSANYWFFVSIVCVKDSYPKGLKDNCKKTYSCAILAKKGMCKKRYSQAMWSGCNNQISKWFQKQPVKNFCKKSCKNCISKLLISMKIFYRAKTLQIYCYRFLLLIFSYVNSTIKIVAPPINCEWNTWQIGDCSVTCGRGTRTKIRTKTINNESNRGKCVGKNRVVESCNPKTCPGKHFKLYFPHCFQLTNL